MLHDTSRMQPFVFASRACSDEETCNMQNSCVMLFILKK